MVRNTIIGVGNYIVKKGSYSLVGIFCRVGLLGANHIDGDYQFVIDCSPIK